MEIEIPSNSIDISLAALRINTKVLLSKLLNSTKVFPNDKGVPRDWRGLAHLVGLRPEDIKLNDPDPTARVLEKWQSQNVPYTIQKLQQFLEELDRFDVLDDAKQFIDEDIKFHLNALNENIPVQVNSSIEDDIDNRILTIHDPQRLSQGFGPQSFHAFVAFSNDDIDFATDLIMKMENEYGLRLCAKERDLVAGLQFEYSAIVELIAKRCNRLIAILSPSFINSAADKFVINYAQAIGIEQKCRKIIPVVYKACKIPRELENMYYLDYERPSHQPNFWFRLRSSIETPTKPAVRIPQPERTIPKVQEMPERSPEKSPEVNPKPKKERVKFESHQDLTVPELTKAEHTASTPALYHGSTSSNTTDKVQTVPAKKTSIIPKFLQLKKKDKKTKDQEKEKKKSKLKKLSLFS